MKVNLVVASGAHQGKMIPITTPQFLIGRDPKCQLRPASQAISKQHCGIFIRNTELVAKDYGSTNGTFVNDEQLPSNSERVLKHGDRLRMGPLDFTIQIVLPKVSDSTPIPDNLQPGSAAAAGLAAASGVKPKPQPLPKAGGGDDDVAAMLLGMDEDDSGSGIPKIPEGSTVFEMPNLNPDGSPKAKPEEKKDASKKGAPSAEESSSAASDILRKYMRRPR